MIASKQLLTALALASSLASGTASAVPHPQAGQPQPIDFRSVLPGSDECTGCDKELVNEAVALSELRGRTRFAG